MRSSAWCRRIDTATLAFGRAEPWPALTTEFVEMGAGCVVERLAPAGVRVVGRSRFGG